MKNKYLFIILLCAFLSSSNIASSNPSKEMLRHAAERQYMEEQIFRLKDRVETLEMDQFGLASEVNELKKVLLEITDQIKSVQIKANDVQKEVDHAKNMIKDNAVKDDAKIVFNGREHIVESGHTLSAIAIAYGSSVKEIKQINNLESDNIYIGQKLLIPE